MALVTFMAETPALGQSTTSTSALPPLDVLPGGDSGLLRGELADGFVTSPETFDLGGATVTGRRAERPQPASRFEVDLQDFRAVPRKDASSQLMLAPGVLTTNTGGEGHAHDTFLRGFAAGTGQDIEFLVDGVPINEVSNAHNHGYADVHFIIPELVETLAVTNGVFDPEQGDFAFAGTAEYRLGVPERGSRLTFSQGSFNTTRVLGVIAPHGMHNGTFGGIEYYQSDGFGENRSAQRSTAMARFTSDPGTDAFRWSTSIYGSTSAWDQAGVIRQDDFESDQIGFFDTYDPNQGGESQRLFAVFDGAVGPSDREVSFNVYLQLRDLRIRENFTGFVQDTQEPQRGDGAEQRYQALTLGSRGAYTLTTTLFEQTQELSLGYALRFDRGRSEQLRLRTITAIPYSIVFDREFDILNLAGWMRTELRPLSWLAVRGGVRLETFSFGVNDLNLPPADREGERVDNQTTGSFGFALNPRVTLELRPFSGLSLLGSYGQGTRSTDAAALSDDETAPFATAQEAEAGFRYALSDPEGKNRLRIQGAYVFAAIDRDLVFEPAAGRNVLVGSSTRHAFLAAVQARFQGWLDALVNVGYTNATLDDTGEQIPYIPEVVVRADVAAHAPLFSWTVGGRAVEGQLGLGLTYVPGRPLPFQAFGDAFVLLSASAQVRVSHFAVGIEGRNLLDREYRQAEFNYASNFRGPTIPGSRTPERHFVAGEPLFVGASVTVFVEDMIRAVASSGRSGPQDPDSETR